MLVRAIRYCVFWLAMLGTLNAARGQVQDLPPDLSKDAEAQGFADLLFAQGMVKLAAKDCTAALPLFEKAAATWPDDATYAYFAAVCQLRLGRPGEAIVSLEKTLPPAANRIGEARVRAGLGEARYRNGDLAGAEEDLRASLRLDDRDAWAHFYLGLTLFAQGEAEASLTEFERAIALDPSLAADGSYYLGVAAFKRGDMAEARRHLERAAPAAPAVAASSREWLLAVETPGGGARPPLGEIRAGLSYEYDNNPAQLTDAFPLPRGRSDTRGVLQVRAGLNPLVTPGGVTLGLVLNGYVSRHSDLEELDLDGLQGIVQVSWGADPLGYVNGPLGYARTPVGEDGLGLLFQAGASYFDLNGESFRRDQEATLSVLARQPGFGKTQVDLQYDDRTFFHPFFQNLTGHVTTGRLGQYFVLGGRPERYLRVAVERSGTTAQFEPLEFDRTAVLAELAVPLGTRWRFFLYGARLEDDYDEQSVLFFGQRREDTRHDASATVVGAIGRHAYVTLRYARVDRDVEPEYLFLSYDRAIASASFTWYW